MRSCGNCDYFTKIKTLEGDSGLCDVMDCRTKSDFGHTCMSFKPMKFDRLAVRHAKDGELSELRFKIEYDPADKITGIS